MEKKHEFWLDSLANRLIDRENSLKRGIKVFRTESGLGASGFPHIGSFGDVARNYAASIALKDHGVKSEFIAYSDDLDGLRKVPLSLPDWLEKYIGMPVSSIPDPFGKCHENFGEHMSSLLLEAADKAGIEYTHQSANENYKKGIFNDKIELLLTNAERIGKIVKDMLGQEKFVASLPFFPICEKCGKVYTTRAYELLPSEHKVLYACDQEFVGKNMNSGKQIVVKGCGHKGETSYLNGNGKLSWKIEFAMRWAALQIVFEACGRDIHDSVNVNDSISKDVLGFEPPLHLVYEMFLDKGGKKVSKSYGNVFTPQVWFNYGSPKSLILLMLKRFEGTRELDVSDIPKYMDELDKLEKVFFGAEKVEDERELNNSMRLFEYVNSMKPPTKTSLIPYNTMTEIARILPESNQMEFALKKLTDMGILKDSSEVISKDVEERIGYAKKWVGDFVINGQEVVSVSDDQKALITKLIATIKKADNQDSLQSDIFEIAKGSGMKPADFFKILYNIILKSERGPKLGPYIFEIGKEEIVRKLKEAIE